ncbi:MAG: F0F1 ATP synthase subunit A [Bacilli bacterium]|jgi:F-type H+-transporting ATPase subunit a|nr:F0F1 ATP synthase subunit A [Bacilli bacterium]
MDIFNKWVNAQSTQTWTFMGIVVFLSVVFVIVGTLIKHLDPFKKPGKLMVIVDFFNNFITNLYTSMFRGHCPQILPYAGMLFILLLTCNLSGLFLPFEPPTTDYNIPLSLVLVSFTFKYVFELKNNGPKEFLKGYTQPVIVMLPLNLMDIIAKPLSMSMRIFGNILSGTLILSVFNQATGFLQNLIFMSPQVDGGPALNILSAILAAPFHFFFDVFCGGIQAFVFTLLTLVFSSLELDLDKMDAKKEAKEKLRIKQQKEMESSKKIA